MIAELAHNLPVTKLPRSDPLSMIDKFEAMLATGKDTALLRCSLGNAYLMAGGAASAYRTGIAAAEANGDKRAAKVGCRSARSRHCPQLSNDEFKLV